MEEMLWVYFFFYLYKYVFGDWDGIIMVNVFDDFVSSIILFMMEGGFFINVV